MSTQDAVKKMMDAFNQHDADAFAALHSAEAVAYDPQYAEPLRGRESIRKDMKDFFLTFPDVQSTISNILADGNTVACEMELSGTNTGPIVTPGETLPATNRRAKMRVGLFASINEQGLITESRRYFDMAGLMQQLGLE